LQTHNTNDFDALNLELYSQYESPPSLLASALAC
jgi:hypothetical protein